MVRLGALVAPMPVAGVMLQQLQQVRTCEDHLCNTRAPYEADRKLVVCTSLYKLHKVAVAQDWCGCSNGDESELR